MVQSIRSSHIERVTLAMLQLAAALVLSAWASASADRIVLKDGSVEISERVWESADSIHFILSGTRDVEIRYSKHIVERIERDADANRKSSNRDDSADETQPAPAISDNHDPIAPEETVTSSGARLTLSHRDIARASKGISFYDPRRPMRYWAHPRSKHDGLEEALNAVAALYKRSAKWVTRHMGDENDLGMIHANLVRQMEAESGAPIGEAVNEVGSSSAQHGERAGEHLIQETKDDQVGNENNSLFHPSTITRARQAVNIAPGIRFYDPRRPQKYWSGRMTRHNTLKEAIAALAARYGTSPGWIEQHMGDTNDLSRIHQSIQQNLSVP